MSFLKRLLLFVCLLLTLTSMSGCTGCTYFHLKIENLDKNNSDQNSNSSSDQNSDGSSNNNSNSGDNTLPIITVTSSTATETDSDFLTTTEGFTLQLNKASTQTITVHYLASSLYATLGTDFDLPEGDITFLPGELSKKINYTIKGDTLGEGLEIFNLQLSNPTNSTLNSMTTQVQGFILDNDPITLNVQPVATAKPNWRDYYYGDSKNAITTGTIVIGDGISGKTHSGESKKVVIPGEYSCSGLRLEDSLGAFNWYCLDTVMPVVFYSSGLKIDKNLSDIITTTSFKTNFVNLYKNNSLLYTSNPATWWSNPFQAVTVNSANGDSVLNINSPGTIYTISTGSVTNSKGLNVTGDQISLVVMPGTTLGTNPSGFSNDCNQIMINYQNCLVNLDGNALWVEGSFIGHTLMNNFRAGVLSSETLTPFYKNSVFKNLNINANGAVTGFGLDTVYYSKILNSKFYGAVAYGISLDGISSYNYLRNIEVYNNQDSGISAENVSDRNILININSHHNKYGIATNNSTYIFNSKFHHNTIGFRGFMGPLESLVGWSQISNNLDIGVYNGAQAIYMFHTMIASQGTYGMLFDQNAMSQIKSYDSLILYNNPIGISLNYSNFNFNDIYIYGGTLGVQAASTVYDDRWTGKLFLNSTSNCSLSNSAQANRGLDGVGCTPYGAASTAQLITSHDGSNLFKGYTNDTLNAQGAFGLAGTLFQIITDWFNFENWSRSWILSSMGQGPCNTNGQNCSIFDWSLQTTDPQIAQIKGAFTPQQNCPSSVHGNKFYSNNYKSVLINAIEIFDDGIGNDDGFCDSDESCFYQPSIWLTEYDPNKTYSQCIFEDGTEVNSVTGVKMYGE